MDVERRPIASLQLDPANARLHPDRNLEAIKASLTRFGQQKPIVIDTDGVVVAGNGTLEAARELGWTELDVVQTPLGRAEAVAFAIADNRTAELAAWDQEALATLLGGLDELDGTGFTQDDLERMFPPEEAGAGDEEGGPDELPSDPVTRPGDLWVLGDHRVLCGDCTSHANLVRLVEGRTYAMAITSPPYASQRAYDEESEFKPIPPDEYVDWFEGVQLRVGEHLAPDGSWFVNIKEHCEDGQRHPYVKDLVLAHVRRWHWRWVEEYAWIHGGTTKAVNQRFKNGWEPVFQFTRQRPHKFNPEAVMHPTDSVPDWGGDHPSMEHLQGQAKQIGSNASLQGSAAGGKDAATEGWAYPSNVLSVGKNREALGHTAAFPVALPRFFVQAYTDEGDLVLDPFLGSGSTLVACDLEGRGCLGLEISPAYCDLVVRRWEALSGAQAHLEGGGSYQATRAARIESGAPGAP